MDYMLRCLLDTIDIAIMLLSKHAILRWLLYILLVYTILSIVAYIDNILNNKKIYNFITKKLK